ncbi:MAG: helix-turn-helix transcriptional regulator, partial [Bacteroidota bacterium]
LSASQFADQVGVQRSSISHILSGRNKPSLDFVLKVTNTFKDVDIYWLLNGKGSFPKNGQKERPSPTPAQVNMFASQDSGTNSNQKKISRIVVFS